MTDTDSPQPTNSPRTVRRGLRDRRQAAHSKLHLDRRVPRLDPPVFVRFKPLEQPTIDAAQKAIEKGKDPRRSVVANANALATACIGIYELDEQGEKRSPLIDDDRDWTEVRFDQGLAAELLTEEQRESGAPIPDKAAAVVQMLYLTDGDIVSEAGELTEWSGYASRDGDEDWSGN
jgi:hypothetical protein